MFFFAQTVAAARFAVLFAGSNTWSNYRHQTDIMTLYGMLIDRGFPRSNIIQLAYDDLAQSSYNPSKGQLFHTLDHVNVYDGSSISFSGKSVTADKFYSTIQTLPTTSSDYVFIYYDNHGGPDILGVPDGCGDYITGEGLDAALNKASQAGLYKYALFGIEACYAGSVAEHFTAPNLVTITASNNQESSYAYCYDSYIGSYLSNEFTWMWINELNDHPSEAVGDLYDHCKANTKQSHVSFYGDESMKTLAISEFLGTPNNKVAARKNPNDAVSQITATAATFATGMKHKSPRVRAQSRLAKSIYDARHQRLTIALEEIAKFVAPNQWEEMLNKKNSVHTPAYLEVLKVFTSKFGDVNGDDLPLLILFKNLAANYPKASIIKGINTIL